MVQAKPGHLGSTGNADALPKYATCDLPGQLFVSHGISDSLSTLVGRTLCVSPCNECYLFHTDNCTDALFSFVTCCIRVAAALTGCQEDSR